MMEHRNIEGSGPGCREAPLPRRPREDFYQDLAPGSKAFTASSRTVTTLSRLGHDYITFGLAAITFSSRQCPASRLVRERPGWQVPSVAVAPGCRRHPRAWGRCRDLFTSRSRLVSLDA